LGAPGHRQRVQFICMLDACHVPGLQADLTRHVIALKICKSGESCASDNKATAHLGRVLRPRKGNRHIQARQQCFILQVRTMWRSKLAVQRAVAGSQADVNLGSWAKAMFL
jgi:hypothetical protein